MTLEDHVGDVLAKARAGLDVPAAEAAGLAGLALADYAELERTGRCHGRPDFRTVAGRLGLDGAKLERLAGGWLPQARDLRLWRELRQITTAEGMAVNCYLVWDEATREAALFDTGWKARPVFNVIAEQGLELKHLFITHGHHDHVAALWEIQRRCPNLKVHSGSAREPADQRNRPDDDIRLGRLHITNRSTPGHAEDGATYVIGHWPEDAPLVAIVGDALFAGSMGRAPGPAFAAARRAIRDQILSLPPDTVIAPGHGPVTTAGEELANNPFFGSSLDPGAS
jgi:hydroxyacylglutathione hydrolase